MNANDVKTLFKVVCAVGTNFKEQKIVIISFFCRVGTIPKKKKEKKRKVHEEDEKYLPYKK